MWTRRSFMAVGGGGLAAFAVPVLARGQSGQLIEMRGTARGERVWFAPVGLAIAPGTRLHFANRDSGNSHTATTYHPQLFDRPRRIPMGAAPWDSGLLQPEESWEVTLDHPGVYDFYCVPHEMAGMVGRIVVGEPGDAGWEHPVMHPGDLPEAALAAFPPVNAILEIGRISGGRPT